MPSFRSRWLAGGSFDHADSATPVTPEERREALFVRSKLLMRIGGGIVIFVAASFATMFNQNTDAIFVIVLLLGFGLGKVVLGMIEQSRWDCGVGLTLLLLTMLMVANSFSSVSLAALAVATVAGLGISVLAFFDRLSAAAIK